MKYMRFGVGWLAGLLCWWGLFGSWVYAADLGGAIQGGLRGVYQENFADYEQRALTVDRSRFGWIFLLGILGHLYVNESFELGVSLGGGEWLVGVGQREGREGGGVLLLKQNGFSRTEARFAQQSEEHWLLQQSLFIRELYASFFWGKGRWSRLDLGMRQRSLAGGLVYDHYALGVFLEWDWRKGRSYVLKKPILLRLDLFLSDSSFTAQGKKSPAVFADLSFVNKGDWLLGAFVGYLYDGDNIAARRMLPYWRQRWTPLEQAPPLCQLLRSSCADLPQTTGHHVWTGLQGHADLRFLTLRLAVLFSISQVSASFQKEKVELGGWGSIVDTTVTIYLARFFSTELFFFFLSGSDEEDAERLPLMTLAPQYQQSDLFFHRNLHSYSSLRGLALGQLFDRLWTLGGRFHLFGEKWQVDLIFAAMVTGGDLPGTPPAPPEGDLAAGGLHMEFGIRGWFQIHRWMRVVFQINHLISGHPLPVYNVPHLFQVIVGLDLMKVLSRD